MGSFFQSDLHLDWLRLVISDSPTRVRLRSPLYQRFCVLFAERNKQAPGSLRVVQQGFNLGRDPGGHNDAAFYEIPIVLQTAGMYSGFGVFNCTRQEPDRVSGDFECYIAGERHLARMAEQAEASHVRTAVDVQHEHRIADLSIES